MPLSLLHRLRDLPLAFIDVETNGRSAKWGAKVIEIGIVRVENGQITSEYQQLLDPRRRISPTITKLTGITPLMCSGQPTFAQQLPNMMPLLNGAAVVGHNVQFDISFLCRELTRAHVCIAQSLGRPPVLDTVRMARQRFGRGGNSLGPLCKRLGIQTDGAHRALADARMTLRLFEKLLSTSGGWDLTLADAFVNQGGAMHLESDDTDMQLPDALRV